MRLGSNLFLRREKFAEINAQIVHDRRGLGWPEGSWFAILLVDRERFRLRIDDDDTRLAIGPVEVDLLLNMAPLIVG